MNQFVDSEYTSVDFFFNFILLMGVRCCAQALSSRRKQSPVVAVVRLLLVLASLVSEFGL